MTGVQYLAEAMKKIFIFALAYPVCHPMGTGGDVKVQVKLYLFFN
jgi:hypothetical protein